MLDDDLSEFVEFNPIGMSEKSTLGRVLHYCELVMAEEKKGNDGFAQYCQIFPRNFEGWYYT